MSFNARPNTNPFDRREATSAHERRTPGAERKTAGSELRRAAWDVAMEEQLEHGEGRVFHEAVYRELMAQQPQLVALAERYLRGAGGRVAWVDAEDLVQQAMLQTATVAYRDGESSLLRLFSRVLKCRAIDAARRPREDRADAGWDDGTPSLWDTHADPRSDDGYVAVEDADEAADLMTRIDALGLLTPAQGAACRAVAAADGDLDLAAADLRIAKSALTTRMSAARRRLREADPEVFGDH